MRLKVIACKVLYRELSLIIAKSKNHIDITYLKQGLHNEPSILKNALTNEIDKIEINQDMYTNEQFYNNDFDAILIGYGLCSNALIGIKSKKYKIVVPRAHDCITLLLGSKEKYREYFNAHKGVYWYAPGWIESTPMPSKERYEFIRKDYTEKYGEKDLDYLMDMEQNWLKEYNYCTFINWDELKNERNKEYTKNCAKYLNWNYDEVKGSSKLIADFIEGNWDNERFLVVPPGKEIDASYKEDILKIKA